MANSTGKGSKRVEPIRRHEDIEKMMDYLKGKGQREYMLFFLGINVFLRISDLVQLKRKDFSGGYLVVREGKTKKEKKQKLHPAVLNDLNVYFDTMNIGPDDYLFTSQKMKYKSLSRVSAWSIMKNAGEQVGLQDIGTHSLRKTYGYHYYRETKDLETLRKLFNHSSQAVTSIYIGITQDDLDEVTTNFALGLGKD